MPGRKESEDTRREEILRAAYDVAARHSIQALTLRAVAARAKVSHGTVLFHFRRREQLVSALLDRVLYATTTLRVADAVRVTTRPSERMLALMLAEMERLTGEPRHFRLFLEYWAIGVRRSTVRRRVVAALASYREAFRALAAQLEERPRGPTARNGAGVPAPTPEGLAAAAVSLIHGCALQSVLAPAAFDIVEHHRAASRLLIGYR